MVCASFEISFRKSWIAVGVLGVERRMFEGGRWWDWEALDIDGWLKRACC